MRSPRATSCRAPARTVRSTRSFGGMLAQESGHHRGIEPVNRIERGRVKRQNHDPRRSVLVAQRRDHGMLDSPGRPGFYFEIKNDVMLFREIEYFLQRRHAFPGKRSAPRSPNHAPASSARICSSVSKCTWPFAARRAVQREVVDGDDPRIPRDLQIGFNEARAQLHGAAKRRHRIFRRVPGSAAMRDRPDGLRSHFPSSLGRLQMIRRLSPSYQTRPPQLEMFERALCPGCFLRQCLHLSKCRVVANAGREWPRKGGLSWESVQVF